MDRESFIQTMADLDFAPLLVVIRRAMGEAVARALEPEDVLQETLAMAWRDHQRHAWVDPASFRRWLLEIARHRILDAADRLRAEKRGGVRVRLSLDDTQADLHAQTSMTPSRTAMTSERARHMEAALQCLRTEHEVLVRGHLFEQVAMTALAMQQGIPLATAWSRFKRGAEIYREELRRRLSVSWTS